jgi:hypothetical protein
MNLGISLTSADDNTSTVKSSAGANHPGQMSPINVQNGSAPYNHSTVRVPYRILISRRRGDFIPELSGRSLYLLSGSLLAHSF